jgi:LacI family transcriptional regulator
MPPALVTVTPCGTPGTAESTGREKTRKPAPLAPGWTVVPGYALDHGRQALAALMAPRDPPTAAFTAGADLALGVVDAARSRGLRVPDELAVVGYTDIEAARIVQPPLTTVAVPAREAGLRAMETLRRLMAGKTVPPKRVVFDVELVVRSSCGRH